MRLRPKQSILVGAAVAVMALSTACDPGELSRPDPGGGGDVDSRQGTTPTGVTQYQFVSFEVLYSTLTVTLGVQEINYPGTPGDPDDPGSPNNPKEDPIGFLLARKASAGGPEYSPNPDETLYGEFSSLGMKNWTLASNGACAISMAGQKGAELFPVSDTDYDEIFLAFMGDLPTAEENVVLDELTAAYTTTVMKRTAVCTTLLGTLQFLTDN